MSATIEERLPALFDSVRGPPDAPLNVYQRLQFVAGLLHAAPAESEGCRLLWWASEGEVGVAAIDVTPLTVGRDPACDVVLTDPRASRRHCEFRREGTAVEVSDLGSSNGTWVNGRRIAAPTSLHDGCVVEVGSTPFVYFSS